MNPLLTLRHLGVFRRGKIMFSEPFRGGVNIIHGDNGSGKSTIADFIFFALGGDLKEWKPHAELAEYTLAEVTAGTTTLTLKREVSPQSGRPMQIFFGPFSAALEAGPTQWRSFPYKRQDDQYSFSQVLFKAMGLPEVIGEGQSNITMHQILRLIYGDQMTPIQRIFRTEIFDTWQTRQAIGELLCGIGGYELYERQIELRTVENQFDDLSGQLRNLFKVASGYGDKILAEFIEPLIANKTTERTALVEQLSATMASDQPSSPEDSEFEQIRKTLARDLSVARRTVAELEDRISVLDYEILDAGHFIKHLEETLAEFDDAATTFFALGQVQFEFCPACFSPTKDVKDLGHCHLCGTGLTANESDSATLAVRLDIEMQLKESRALQEDRLHTRMILKGKLRSAKSALHQATEASELARRGYGTDRESLVAELGRRIGFLDSELQGLQKRLELATEIALLSAEKERLSQRISSLKDSIAAIVSSQASRKQKAYTAVSENSKRVLMQDLAEHNDFGDVTHISFSFPEDWMAVNDDKNRSRSASGMVVLKNSFLFGLYLSALEDPSFGLPRFLLLDNIEDKGMVQERSWNFQRIIVSESAKYESPHQVIFTTSKIAPELADSDYVIGRKYTRERRSLENAG